MSKYFTRYASTKDKKTKELIYLKQQIMRYGELHCSDEKLKGLWSCFSEEEYGETYLKPDELLVYEFTEWLNRQKEVTNVCR